MARTLILDSEALNALARAKERPTLALRARAILTVAHEERALVRVPSPVLAEVYRGGARDAPIDHVLNDRGIIVTPLTASIARRGGALLARAKLSSAHAVDAFVVATAIELGPAIVATHDPDDMKKLSAGIREVRVVSI
ncbi:MAG: PIN domain-containing protein [Labilithrix sp.]|nr:PIN domain-containing protein [Labilithrix sp.]MCW5832275.1 PIN domain-containing protein [Labilithrix sp.]